MPAPPIALFMTTIASQPALRQRQEYILRTLQVKKIPYSTYDLASDEDAKRFWKRKAPPTKQQLPGILVGGKFPGTFAEFEDAVEHDELDIFLRRGEDWDPVIDEDRPMPEVKPVGVPGAVTPLEMTPEPLRKKILAGSPANSPMKGKKTIPVNKRTDEVDVGDDLGDHGLQGVKATRDELRELIEELGLGGNDAGDLARGLSDLSISGKDEAAKETPANDPAVKAKNPEPRGEQNTELNDARSSKESAADHTEKATEIVEEKAEVISEGASSEAKNENE